MKATALALFVSLIASLSARADAPGAGWKVDPETLDGARHAGADFFHDQADHGRSLVGDG